MTEEEKHRLDDLLKDVDNIPELPDNLENVVGYCLSLRYEPRHEKTCHFFF